MLPAFLSSIQAAADERQHELVAAFLSDNLVPKPVDHISESCDKDYSLDRLADDGCPHHE